MGRLVDSLSRSASALILPAESNIIVTSPKPAPIYSSESSYHGGEEMRLVFGELFRGGKPFC